MNKVILRGNLGSEPECRFTQNGTAVCNFRLATNERFTDANGQKKELTEWHRVTVWGKTAEVCSQYLNKGREVLLEGKLHTREWKDKEGVTRYTTEIVASYVEFLSGGRKQEAQQSAQENVLPEAQEEEAQELQASDGVPF